MKRKQSASNSNKKQKTLPTNESTLPFSITSSTTITQPFSGDELFTIFQFLPPNFLLSTCSTVHSVWRSISHSNGLWQGHCSCLLMNDVFQWDQLALHPYHKDEPNYWYKLFRILFWFPHLSHYRLLYQSDDDDDKDDESNSDESDEDSDDDERRIYNTLEVEYYYEICKPFHKSIEDAGSRFFHSKLCVILSILYKEGQFPDLWHDQVIVGRCLMKGRKTVMVESIRMTLAAFCVCIMNESSFKKLKELLHMEMKDFTLSVAPHVEDSENMEPFCLFELMDEHFHDVDKMWMASCEEHPQWAPHVFNAGAKLTDYKFKVFYLKNKRQFKLQRFERLEYC